MQEIDFRLIAIRNIDLACKAIERINDNTQFELMRNEINASIINAVHSIADWYERNKDKSSTDGEKLMKACMYVNNQIKHDQNLVAFHDEVCGSMFPLSFPMRFGKPGVYWRNFKDHGDKNARGKRQHYDEMLNGRDILVTLACIKETLESFDLSKDAKNTYV